MRRHLLCFIFFLVSIFVHAQKPDSTYYTSSTRTQNLLGLSESSKATDTTIDNTYNYYQTGVLGNMGLPSYSLIAEQPKHTSSSFFSWNKLNNRKDLITEDDPLYFKTEKIYTKITAAVGLKQEQFLKLVHVQQIRKKVNVSLMFNRYSCTGFYLQQQSLTTNLLLSSNYKTDNGRWGYKAYYLFNKLKYQLNGGIPGDSLVGSLTYPAPNLIPTNFTSGIAKQLIKTSAMSFNTFFRLNAEDSARSSHYLVFETNYQSNYLLYVDGIADTIGGSKNTYLNQITGSHDSTGTRIFSNSLLYKFSAANGKFIFYGGYKNEAIKYRQHRLDTTGLNHIIKGGFILNSNKYMLNATADYVVSGFNGNNYELDANYRFNIKEHFYISADAQIQSRLPDFNLLFYNGNRFLWTNNNFKDVQTQNATFSLTNKKYKFYFGAFIQQQQHQVYFNTEALPTQYNNGSTMITRFFAGKDLKLACLHFNNNINYQITADTNIIRLPKWVTTHQLYCEGKFFKKNLWLQIGFQARYISSYKANAYMPATNQFYLQNEKDYGNYVFIDFFINAQIKPVKFFIMAQHLNQGFMGNNYILTPNYPMPDRSFKAGLSWMLFN